MLIKLPLATCEEDVYINPNHVVEVFQNRGNTIIRTVLYQPEDGNWQIALPISEVVLLLNKTKE